ncbi:MAG TPA: hypothetical protein VK826_15375 [Bacteroidia bacterium]|nr:hypothetical protein [Bacteroidia bacterium]
MKKLLLLPALALLFAFETDPADTHKDPPACEITFCKPAEKLDKGKARIEFTFKDNAGNIITDSILMTYNGTPKTLFPSSAGTSNLVVEPGKYKFVLYAGTGFGEIYSDSIDIKVNCLTGIAVTFSPVYKIITVDKPVIYVYPDVSREVNIQLNVNGELGFTYPLYNRGWNFTADPDGTIHMNGNEYSYLFWDAQSPFDVNSVDVHSGFIVKKDSLTSFFEAKLTAMNLTPRERQDFITYWCPLMQKNEKSYVHFLFNEEYNSIATLNVTPAPDDIFRVLMVWSDAAAIDASVVHEQKIETAVRDGFTVIEWGGAETGAPKDLLSKK